MVDKSGVRPLGPLSKRKLMTDIDKCVEDGDFKSTFSKSPILHLKKDRNHRNRYIRVYYTLN